MKNPMTLAGIEPATFRFVEQHLNHCATAVSQVLYISIVKYNTYTLLLCLTVTLNILFQYQTFLLPTDTQKKCFKRGIKIYITIKTAPTCFGVITVIRERTV